MIPNQQTATSQSRRSGPGWLAGWLAFSALIALLATGAATSAVCAAATGNTISESSSESTGETGATDRWGLLQQLGQQIRAGDLATARTTALTYLDKFPEDGTMFYNLACLEARLSQPEAAWSALHQAFASGFTDVYQIEADPDLESLRNNGGFADWLAQCRTELARRAQAKGLTLRDGYWSEDLHLESNGPFGDDPVQARVQAKLHASATELSIQATVQASDSDDRQPWHNRGNFLVNLVAPPDNPTAFASFRYFSFGFGLANGEPQGVFVGRHGQRLDQRIVELDPRIRHHGEGQTTWTMKIPWRSIEPYAPPLDSLLGVNIVYLEVDETGTRRTVSLIADPHADSDHTPWRRYVPLHILPSDRTLPVFTGRISQTIVGDEAVALTLVAWSANSGQGTLSIEFSDHSGNPVVASGQGSSGVTLQAGSNHWQRQAGLSALPTGLYQIQVILDFPDGDQLTWRANLLRMRDDWYESLSQRLAAVRADERLSLKIRLDAVRQAQAQHHPWDDPARVSTTLAEIGMMIQRAELTGTILEPAEVTLVAVPGVGGSTQTAMLYLPPDFHRRKPGDVLLLFPDRTGDETRLARQVAAALTDSIAPVLLVPLVPGETKRRVDNALVSGQAILAWARGRFETTPAYLVGLGRGAADALHFSLRHPTDCRAALMLVNDVFAPWPGWDTTELEKTLITQRNDVPLTFARLPGDAAGTGQALSLVNALQKTGFSVREDLTAGRPRPDSAAEFIAGWFISSYRKPE